MDLNAVMAGVCESARAFLEGNDSALEVLDDYQMDAEKGLMTPERLRGFLHGLFAAGAIELEDYDDLDRELAAGE